MYGDETIHKDWGKILTAVCLKKSWGSGLWDCAGSGMLGKVV